ncbi:MAG: RNA polymerase sigma factor [Fimbriimonas sp.]
MAWKAMPRSNNLPSLGNGVGERVKMTSADTQRLEKLFDEHGARIYAFCLRLCGNAADAEDLAAEVFLEAPQSLRRFRGEASEATLLYRIAVNKHRMAQRSHVRLMRRTLAWMRPERQDSHESAVVHEAAFAWALERIGPKLKEAFLLVRAEGFTYSESAAILNVPVGTVQSRVHEAGKRLAELLEAQPNSPFTEATNEV